MAPQVRLELTTHGLIPRLRDCSNYCLNMFTYGAFALSGLGLSIPVLCTCNVLLEMHFYLEEFVISFEKSL